MTLLTKEVKIKVHNKRKYYEALGYKVPLRKTRDGMKMAKNTEIIVNVKDLPKTSKYKVKVKCNYCNKEYELSYCKYLEHVHDGDISYCQKCHSKALISGENSHWWNSELTNEDREIQRNTNERDNFIKRVMARDNHTCKCCNKKLNHNGVVHHLDGWDNFKEKRYDDTNGITLCEICHKNFHSIYGYGNNTKQQFEEWLGRAIELLKYEGELPTARKVYCIEEDKIYDSVIQLVDEWGLKNKSCVYNVCNHRKITKGYYKSVKGKHLLWLDEYEKCTEEDIQRYLDWCKPKSNRNKGEKNPMSIKIICTTTNEVFNSMNEAEKKYNIYKGGISAYLKGDRKTAGKLNGMSLHWMYYDEWILKKLK